MHYDDEPRIITRDTHTEVTRTTSGFGALSAAAVIFAALAALGVIWMVVMDDRPSAPPVAAPTVIMPIPSQPAPQPLPPLVMSPLPDPVLEADKRAMEQATRDAKKATQEARDAARSTPPPAPEPVPQPVVPEPTN